MKHLIESSYYECVDREMELYWGHISILVCQGYHQKRQAGDFVD